MEEDLRQAARLRSLLATGVKTGNFSIFVAIRKGHWNCLKVLLDSGCATSVRDPRDNNAVPLHVSVKLNQERCTQLLLDHGANVNEPDDNGFTPLHHAASLGLGVMADLLLQYKPDLDQKDRNGKTPLEVAQAAVQIGVAQQILMAQMGVSAGGEVEVGDALPLQDAPVGMRYSASRRKLLRDRSYKEKRGVTQKTLPALQGLSANPMAETVPLPTPPLLPKPPAAQHTTTPLARRAVVDISTPEQAEASMSAMLPVLASTQERSRPGLFGRVGKALGRFGVAGKRGSAAEQGVLPSQSSPVKQLAPIANPAVIPSVGSLRARTVQAFVPDLDRAPNYFRLKKMEQRRYIIKMSWNVFYIIACVMTIVTAFVGMNYIDNVVARGDFSPPDGEVKLLDTMTILDSRKVGINTAAPRRTMEVSSGSADNPIVRVSHGSDAPNAMGLELGGYGAGEVFAAHSSIFHILGADGGTAFAGPQRRRLLGSGSVVFPTVVTTGLHITSASTMALDATETVVVHSEAVRLLAERSEHGGGRIELVASAQVDVATDGADGLRLRSVGEGGIGLSTGDDHSRITMSGSGGPVLDETLEGIVMATKQEVDVVALGSIRIRSVKESGLGGSGDVVMATGTGSLSVMSTSSRAGLKVDGASGNVTVLGGETEGSVVVESLDTFSVQISDKSSLIMNKDVTLRSREGRVQLTGPAGLALSSGAGSIVLAGSPVGPGLASIDISSAEGFVRVRGAGDSGLALSESGGVVLSSALEGKITLDSEGPMFMKSAGEISVSADVGDIGVSAAQGSVLMASSAVSGGTSVIYLDGQNEFASVSAGASITLASASPGDAGSSVTIHKTEGVFVTSETGVVSMSGPGGVLASSAAGGLLTLTESGSVVVATAASSLTMEADGDVAAAAKQVSVTATGAVDVKVGQSSLGLTPSEVLLQSMGGGLVLSAASDEFFEAGLGKGIVVHSPSSILLNASDAANSANVTVTSGGQVLLTSADDSAALLLNPTDNPGTATLAGFSSLVLVSSQASLVFDSSSGVVLETVGSYDISLTGGSLRLQSRTGTLLEAERDCSLSVAGGLLISVGGGSGGALEVTEAGQATFGVAADMSLSSEGVVDIAAASGLKAEVCDAGGSVCTSVEMDGRDVSVSASNEMSLRAAGSMVMANAAGESLSFSGENGVRLATSVSQAAIDIVSGGGGIVLNDTAGHELTLNAIDGMNVRTGPLGASLSMGVDGDVALLSGPTGSVHMQGNAGVILATGVPMEQPTVAVSPDSVIIGSMTGAVDVLLLAKEGVVAMSVASDESVFALSDQGLAHLETGDWTAVTNTTTLRSKGAVLTLAEDTDDGIRFAIASATEESSITAATDAMTIRSSSDVSVNSEDGVLSLLGQEGVALQAPNGAFVTSVASDFNVSTSGGSRLELLKSGSVLLGSSTGAELALDAAGGLLVSAVEGLALQSTGGDVLVSSAEELQSVRLGNSLGVLLASGGKPISLSTGVSTLDLDATGGLTVTSTGFSLTSGSGPIDMSSTDNSITFNSELSSGSAGVSMGLSSVGAFSLAAVSGAIQSRLLVQPSAVLMTVGDSLLSLDGSGSLALYSSLGGGLMVDEESSLYLTSSGGDILAVSEAGNIALVDGSGNGVFTFDNELGLSGDSRLNVTSMTGPVILTSVVGGSSLTVSPEGNVLLTAGPTGAVSVEAGAGLSVVASSGSSVEIREAVDITYAESFGVRGRDGAAQQASVVTTGVGAAGWQMAAANGDSVLELQSESLRLQTSAYDGLKFADRELVLSSVENITLSLGKTFSVSSDSGASILMGPAGGVSLEAAGSAGLALDADGSVSVTSTQTSGIDILSAGPASLTAALGDIGVESSEGGIDFNAYRSIGLSAGMDFKADSGTLSLLSYRSGVSDFDAYLSLSGSGVSLFSSSYPVSIASFSSSVRISANESKAFLDLSGVGQASLQASSGAFLDLTTTGRVLLGSVSGGDVHVNSDGTLRLDSGSGSFFDIAASGLVAIASEDGIDMVSNKGAHLLLDDFGGVELTSANLQGMTLSSQSDLSLQMTSCGSSMTFAESGAIAVESCSATGVGVLSGAGVTLDTNSGTGPKLELKALGDAVLSSTSGKGIGLLSSSQVNIVASSGSRIDLTDHVDIASRADSTVTIAAGTQLQLSTSSASLNMYASGVVELASNDEQVTVVGSNGVLLESGAGGSAASFELFPSGSATLRTTVDQLLYLASAGSVEVAGNGGQVTIPTTSAAPMQVVSGTSFDMEIVSGQSLALKALGRSAGLLNLAADGAVTLSSASNKKLKLDGSGDILLKSGIDSAYSAELKLLSTGAAQLTSATGGDMNIISGGVLQLTSCGASCGFVTLDIDGGVNIQSANNLDITLQSEGSFIVEANYGTVGNPSMSVTASTTTVDAGTNGNIMQQAGRSIKLQSASTDSYHAMVDLGQASAGGASATLTAGGTGTVKIVSEGGAVELIGNQDSVESSITLGASGLVRVSSGGTQDVQVESEGGISLATKFGSTDVATLTLRDVITLSTKNVQPININSGGDISMVANAVSGVSKASMVIGQDGAIAINTASYSALQLASGGDIRLDAINADNAQQYSKIFLDDEGALLVSSTDSVTLQANEVQLKSPTNDLHMLVGNQASSSHTNTFVSSDGFVTVSPGPNSFTARASGGVYFYTASTGTNVGAYLASGSSVWSTLSDRDSKTLFQAVDHQRTLDHIRAMDVSTWKYKGGVEIHGQDGAPRHMGPVAQDFHAAFGLGDSEKRLTANDLGGAALSAVKGVDANVRRLEGLVDSLRTQIRMLAAVVGIQCFVFMSMVVLAFVHVRKSRRVRLNPI